MCKVCPNALPCLFVIFVIVITRLLASYNNLNIAFVINTGSVGTAYYPLYGKLAVVTFGGIELPVYKVSRLKFDGTQLFDAILNDRLKPKYFLQV